jgi:hypothetical protein
LLDVNTCHYRNFQPEQAHRVRARRDSRRLFYFRQYALGSVTGVMVPEFTFGLRFESGAEIGRLLLGAGAAYLAIAVPFL